MPGSANRSDSRSIAVLNRKFWPISGAAELEVGNLCRSLTDAGHHVDILTVRWQKHWPSKFRYHRCDVYRLSKLSSGPFGTFRFLKSLTAHFLKHAYDDVIVFGIGEESHTAATSLGDQQNLILRITQLHLINVHTFSARQNETFKSATSILADTTGTAEFITRQLPEIKDRVRIIPALHGLPAPPGDTQTNRSTRKSAARIALSDAHPILQIEPDHPLVITAAAMENDLGVCDLVQAWKQVQRKHTKGRLWILGEGRLSRSVWDEILELDLVYTAIMPGFFDNLSLVLDAADLYVHPLRSPSSCSVLETAKAIGLCTVQTASLEELQSSATQSSRPFVECPQQGLLVPRETPATIAATINHIIDHPDYALQWGAQVQQHMLNRIAASPRLSESWITPLASAVPSKTS
jgi:glycosyltransferase involved in cell wall biosynthesis